MATNSTTTEPATTVQGLGTTSTADLKLVYPGSPLYDGTYTPDKLVSIFEALVLAPTVNDGGIMFGVFHRDFSESPDLSTVATGGGGLPGSPYAPNIASPGPGVNPRNIPAAGVQATAEQKGSGGTFNGDGLQSPSDSSGKIANENETLGTLIFGEAYTRS